MTKESTYLPTIRLWTRDRLVLYMALATSLESNEIKLYVAPSLLKLSGHLVCMDSILIVSQTRHRRSSGKKISLQQNYFIKNNKTSYISVQVTLLLVILLLWILCHTQEKPLKRLNQNLKKLSQAEGKKWHVGGCNFSND